MGPFLVCYSLYGMLADGKESHTFDILVHECILFSKLSHEDKIDSTSSPWMV